MDRDGSPWRLDVPTPDVLANRYRFLMRTTTHKAPERKNRSLVDVTMTVTRAENPTVVQHQLRCAKR